MPLEIRELVIKVNIEKNMPSNAQEIDTKRLADMKLEIIRECTKAILSRINVNGDR